MLQNVLKRLLAPTAPDTSHKLSHGDAHLALTALLVRVARSDGHYDQAEVTAIHAHARRRFDLDESGARALIAEAEQLEADAPDTVRFTRALKEAVPSDQRRDILEALWEVALADGARDAMEDRQLRLVAGLLGVTDTESARARQAVIARKGIAK